MKLKNHIENIIFIILYELVYQWINSLFIKFKC